MYSNTCRQSNAWTSSLLVSIDSIRKSNKYQVFVCYLSKCYVLNFSRIRINDSTIRKQSFASIFLDKVWTIVSEVLLGMMPFKMQAFVCIMNLSKQFFKTQFNSNFFYWFIVINISINSKSFFSFVTVYVASHSVSRIREELGTIDAGFWKFCDDLIASFFPALTAILLQFNVVYFFSSLFYLNSLLLYYLLLSSTKLPQ